MKTLGTLSSLSCTLLEGVALPNMDCKVVEISPLNIEHTSSSVQHRPSALVPDCAGTGMRRNAAQIANEQIISQVLRKKIGPSDKTGSSRISLLLHNASSDACSQAHPSKPVSSPEVPVRQGVSMPQPAQFDGLPARRDGHITMCAEPTGGGQQGHASSPCMLPSELLQQGVRSMGSALEVHPSPFGGFTVREDYIAKTVTAMRQAMDHTRSLPTVAQLSLALTPAHVAVQHQVTHDAGPASMQASQMCPLAARGTATAAGHAKACMVHQSLDLS